MKRICFHDYGPTEMLQYEDAEMPVAGPGKLLVRVAAVSVNPVDWKIGSGAARAVVTDPLPLVPGGDLAGTIEAVGDGVTGWSVGDAVIAQIGLWGAYAQYVAIDAAAAAKKPANLSFVEAAALPLAALTVLQGFEADGRDLAGLNILIHNAAGGVGSIAVQYAKALGARVIATASRSNAAFVTSLGADEVVDFRETPVASHARDIDILMDLVGNPAALELWSLVKPGGSVIRIAGGADAPPSAEGDGIRALKVRVRPNGAQLGRITELVEKGAIKPEIAKVFPLFSAAEAQDFSRTGRVRGKIVLETGA